MLFAILSPRLLLVFVTFVTDPLDAAPIAPDLELVVFFFCVGLVAPVRGVTDPLDAAPTDPLLAVVPPECEDVFLVGVLRFWFLLEEALEPPR